MMSKKLSFSEMRKINGEWVSLGSPMQNSLFFFSISLYHSTPAICKSFLEHFQKVMVLHLVFSVFSGKYSLMTLPRLKLLPELCYPLSVIPMCSLYKIPSQPLSSYSMPGSHLLSVWGCCHHSGRYRKHQNQDSPRAGKSAMWLGPDVDIGILHNLMYFN